MRKKGKKKTGPKPDHLQLDDESWETALKKAIKKKKPKEGWPKKEKENQNLNNKFFKILIKMIGKFRIKIYSLILL